MVEIIILVLVLIAVGQLSLLLARRASLAGPHYRRDEVVLDTCALIDGRIIELVSSGFLRSRLVIPRSVLAELQHLADHGDSYKRDRARYGLDVARQLQETGNVVVTKESLDNHKPVDERLIAIAKRRRALLYTTDFNLNKVANIEGVKVLNVNELSQSLRPHVLPGETKEVKIIDRGQDKQQGVGYLADGTMVVVERAGKLVGKTLRVEFTRMLQTQAGRMMFAHIRKAPSGQNTED